MPSKFWWSTTWRRLQPRIDDSICEEISLTRRREWRNDRVADRSKLALTRRYGICDVLVIDRVEKPSTDKNGFVDTRKARVQRY